MVATQAEMAEALLPLHWRDYCAHLLIPLNACRRDTLGVPWKCGHERHAYEQCQYNESDTMQQIHTTAQHALDTSMPALLICSPSPPLSFCAVSYLWRQEAQRQSKATAAAEAEQHQAAKK